MQVEKICEEPHDKFPLPFEFMMRFLCLQPVKVVSKKVYWFCNNMLFLLIMKDIEEEIVDRDGKERKNLDVVPGV